MLGRIPDAVERHRTELDEALLVDRAYPIAAIRRDRAGLLADVAAARAAPDPVVDRHPVTGEVLCVLPYNLGYWALIPVVNCLAAGNRVRLRLPRDAQRSAAVFASMVQDVARPHRIAVDHCPGRELAAWAAEDPSCGAVCFYGSDTAGEAYRPAAEGGRTILVEGPGNDPLIVLPDAADDLAGVVAARKVAFGSGQACFAPERILVHTSCYESFVEALAAAFERLRVGPPGDPRTDVGPILHTGVRRRLQEQLQDAVAKGADVVTGGAILDSEPTVVAGVTPDMRVTGEEVFGPAVYVSRFEHDEEAVQLATASDYRLAASVWGRSGSGRLSAMLQGPRRLVEAGAVDGRRFGVVTVNRFATGNSLHEPFGGYGRSGWVWRHVGGRLQTWQGPKLVAREMSLPVRGVTG